ncbi:ParB/RepB/Spo0J family partition protein [Coralliovum pocilloporae]|uniref:ParB/RepB/Spo0J family partition protein n=1 Tax=Coralliovum pocilloporae TaxID=3066369 RepID=UPI0033072D59
MADESRKRLGRGLAALMGDIDSEAEAIERSRTQRRIPIEFVRANPRNPRKTFAEDDLTDLTNSIKEKGIVQPILVRPVADETDSYELIAGERRWRAAQRAGLHEVPVLIHDVSDKEALEIAIIENVQRADLNPLEEALGYQQLMEEFQYTQQDLADVIAKSRSHVANTLRLLKLPNSVQDYLSEGLLTAGHARALITSDEPAALAEQIVEHGLSVREAERLGQEGLPEAKPKAPKKEKDADTKALEKALSDALGMKVSISHKDNETGSVQIKYKSLDQLEDLSKRLQG